MKKSILIVFSIFSTVIPLFANTTVNVGETATLNCTANAPANGWITHAYFAVLDSSDSEYLGISYTSSDLKATIYGIKAKAGIKVEVTYAYSYRGTYDGNIHVGHGSYIETVTVKNGSGPAPTSITITPSSVTMSVGETIRVEAVVTPSNAYTTYSWGSVMGLGKPYNFSVTQLGKIAEITASGTGTLYLAVQTSNGKTGTCIIEAIESDIQPLSIVIKEKDLHLMIGESARLHYILEPANANAKITYSSSDETIVSVNNGRLKALKGGTVTITVSTDNGLHASVKVTVYPEPTSISLPSSVTMYLGYSVTLMPKFLPVGSKGTVTWESSDKTLATVSSKGVVKAVSCGTAEITAMSGEKTAKCKVTVIEPAAGMDNRNVTSRIQRIKSMVNQEIEKIR